MELNIPLNIPERVALLQILPAEGDFTTLKVLRELQSALGFSEADHKRFKIVRSAERVSWDPTEGAKEVEIKLGEKATEIVKDALLNLDKTKKLRPEHFTAYEKFVQDKGEKEEKKEEKKE